LLPNCEAFSIGLSRHRGAVAWRHGAHPSTFYRPALSTIPPRPRPRTTLIAAHPEEIGEEEEDEDVPVPDDEGANAAPYSESDQDGSRARAIRTRLRNSSSLFRSVSWVAWWAQVITSTVSAVILLFSNSITDRQARASFLSNGVLLAGAGLTLSAVSIFWTYGYIVRARRWSSRRLQLPQQPDKLPEIRRQTIRSLRVGVYINLLGMLVTLLGAEQIVGTLVAKGFQPFSGPVVAGSVGAAQLSASQFRALDIFIVQANTNTLLSHFAGLCNALFLRGKA
ncbi:unnamed protein product, partial [Phaeothamnion confervicola]